ncbi:MAG: polysaccharide deacetylase family protein [Clostridia bacterium]|nr:polysaccharide deacetylase family protein [Clostridia bacterium]
MKKFLCLAAALIVLQTAVCAAQPDVLLYHNISESYHKSQADMNITAEDFENHIASLIENGYNIISFNTYIDHINGLCDLPEKSVIITFDDGYLSNYTVAFPILRKYGAYGTVFVVTSRVGSYDTQYPHFTWKQAKEMVDSGIMSIYSHTVSHTNMLERSANEIAYEVRKSKYIIEKNLGVKCNVLAAPHGLFSKTATFVIGESGYDVLCRVGDICIDENTDSVISLRRYTVHGDMSAADVISMINQGG